MARDPKVIFLMADYGHDPTETAIPYEVFKDAGFSIAFATEEGKPIECDQRMLTGTTGSLLGAPSPAKMAYKGLTELETFQHPLVWTNLDFSLNGFDLVFLPGGHDKSIKQIIENPTMHKLLASYFPQTSKKSGNKKCLAAICHGVQVLAAASVDGEVTTAGGGEKGKKSVMHDATTTALPVIFESSIFQATRLFLGDYYKTYGSSSANVEDVVKEVLDDPKTQWKGSVNPGTPFVVEDPKYNYVSGRFPLDAEPLAKKAIEMVKQVLSE